MRTSKTQPLFKVAARGFTLVELLVVFGIVATLAVLGFLGSARFIDKGKKVQAMAQFRDFQIGLAMFEVDYQKPPIPESKQWDGYDTIYGNPNPLYHNGFLIAALVGESKDFAYAGETFRVDDVNRLKQSYIQFPFKADKKGGVGKDGNLYDPWGREVIVAAMAFKAETSTWSISGKAKVIAASTLGNWRNTPTPSRRIKPTSSGPTARTGKKAGLRPARDPS
jgi:prepilin-type N-terminal cleavage/methylation domain-containing protein